MKEIQILSKNDVYTVFVDDEDYPVISRHHWNILFVGTGQKPYAFTRLYNEKKKNGKTLLMHSMIMGNVNQHDHINGNSLDNQKHNLRPATHQQNAWNAKKRMITCTGNPPSSKYKGVSKYTNTKGETLWRVLFILTKKGEKPVRHFRKHGFKTEIEAARFYNQEVIKYRGEYALLNQIANI